MNYDPPYIYSNIFNDSYFTDLDGNLTLADADKRYLKLSGGIVYGLSTFTNGLNVNVLSASSRIETNNNSNTLITNSSFCDTYGLHLHSVLASSNGMYSGSSIAFNNSLSDNVPLSSINLDKIGSGNGNLVFGTRNGATCDERVRITSNGLNVSGNYYLNNVLVDFSVIQGITLGSAANNKVLTLDNTGSISTITSLTSTTYYGTTANIQFMNNDILSAAINCNAPIFYADSVNNTTTNQTYQQWNNSIGTPITVEMDINNVSPMFGTTSNHLMRFMTNNTERLRINSGGNVSIGNTNNTYKLDITGTAQATTLRVKGNGTVDFLMDAITGVGGTDAGLRIYPSTQGLLTYSNMSFFNVGATVNIACISTENQNVLHARPQTTADTNATMPNVGFVSGKNAICRDALMITANSLTNSSNFTPVAKFTICASQTYPDGGFNKALRITNPNFVNEFQIQITDANGGDTWFGNISNTGLRFGTNNSTQMYLSNAGRLGIGTTSPNAPLQVAGSNSSITIIPIGTISYSYDVSSNNWQNRGGGPFTLTNVSASFGGNIYIQAGIWATSDRRLKENIKEIDLPFERYKALKPVSYNYKLEEKSRVGFIAQDVMEVCAQAISMSANENLHDEGLNSPEGVQLSLDYNAITVLNTNIIQKLIERVEVLEAKLLEKNI